VFQKGECGVVSLACFESDHDEKTKHKASRYRLCQFEAIVWGDFDLIPECNEELCALLLDESSWTDHGRRMLREASRRAR